MINPVTLIINGKECKINKEVAGTLEFKRSDGHS